VTGRWTGRGHGLTGCIQSVQRGSQAHGCLGLHPARPVPRGTGAADLASRGEARGIELRGRVAHLVTCDQTHLVTMGAL
jgi:hypothetical protein